jgi:hypothetical protein
VKGDGDKDTRTVPSAPGTLPTGAIDLLSGFAQHQSSMVLEGREWSSGDAVKTTDNQVFLVCGFAAVSSRKQELDRVKPWVILRNQK